jgi:uncharacterized protein (TIGR00251 family)
MTATAGSRRDDCLYLDIRLQPRASRDEIIGVQADGRVKVRITAPPVDGKANAHLIRFLAGAFRVPRAAVTLVSGHSGRHKRLRIENPAHLPEALKNHI